MLDAPAMLFQKLGDPASLAHDANIAVSIVRQLQAMAHDLKSWINFPLWNRTGDAKDFSVGSYAGPALSTSYASQMPFASSVVSQLSAEGLDIEYARIAVLQNRDVIRCHVDMYRGVRLMMPLSEQGTDFRHVFGEFCIAMHAGELWGVDGQTCHGAANIARFGHRVMLLIDARSHERRQPRWLNEKWRIPPERLVLRLPWTSEVRIATRQRALGLVSQGGGQQCNEGEIRAAEKEWLFIPFEYSIAPEQAYRELVTFCEFLAKQATDAVTADFWSRRASYWVERSCICVPPAL